MEQDNRVQQNGKFHDHRIQHGFQNNQQELSNMKNCSLVDPLLLQCNNIETRPTQESKEENIRVTKHRVYLHCH